MPRGLFSRGSEQGSAAQSSSPAGSNQTRSRRIWKQHKALGWGSGSTSRDAPARRARGLEGSPCLRAPKGKAASP